MIYDPDQGRAEDYPAPVEFSVVEFPPTARQIYEIIAVGVLTFSAFFIMGVLIFRHIPG